MILFAKSMSILKPPGSGADSGLSFLQPFSGLNRNQPKVCRSAEWCRQYLQLEQVRQKANPVARIVALASFMAVSITQLQTSVVSFRSFRLSEPQEVFAKQ